MHAAMVPDHGGGCFKLRSAKLRGPWNDLCKAYKAMISSHLARENDLSTNDGECPAFYKAAAAAVKALLAVAIASCMALSLLLRASACCRLLTVASAPASATRLSSMEATSPSVSRAPGGHGTQLASCPSSSLIPPQTGERLHDAR